MAGATLKDRPIIHACLNGDIDNYMELRAIVETSGQVIPESITTDTKIIPLLIEHYLTSGVDVTEAFRLAVSDFQGSHAIAMHTDLAPDDSSWPRRAAARPFSSDWPKTITCRHQRCTGSSKKRPPF